MAATAPASALRARNSACLLVTRIVSPLSLVAALVLASACSPVGWHPAATPAPEPPVGPAVESRPDREGSADGVEDAAGVEELFGGPAEVAESPAVTLLDAEGVGRDLRLNFPGFLAAGLPEAALDQVLGNVGLFHNGRARANFELWLEREGRYRDLILPELAAAGLPEELFYLAMLESGFLTTAVSRAGAVGLWQFMPATGRAEGLRIDSWVDERRDPIAATRAAVAHLGMLHRELGDWALAAAAYNAGLGRVRRARGDSGAGYFDLTLSGRLPAETRGYVPLILAASHVARHREYYGFGHVVPEPPLRYDTVNVEGRTRLSAMSRATGVALPELTVLNIHLVRGAAPPGGSYAVRIPVGTATAELGARLALMPAEERLLPEYREIHAVVRPGDSWWRIARNHSVTVADLRARNPGIGDVIHPGMRLLVERRIVRDGDGPAAGVQTPSDGSGT